MNVAFRSIVLIVSVVVAMPAHAVFGQANRFTAQFASGKRMTGAELRSWHDATVEPHLDSTRLMAPEDRLLWVEDTTVAAALDVSACVEFFGGDRLPGRVVDYLAGGDQPYRKLPPCVVVAPSVNVDWPDLRRPAGIPVLARWLRRVIWQKRDDNRYRPGTLFYVDGRQVEFRSVRWQKSSVKILIDQEQRDVPFDQIAELHLPRIDPWDFWFHQAAALNPDLTSWLMQIETGEGLRVTTSQKRFLPTFRGDGGNPDHWYQGFQPVWSAEPLWVRHRSVRTRRFFLPHEVPLTAIEPRRSSMRANLSNGWSWQVDRNVHSLPLRSADAPWGWGFGVHAYAELTFDLPACVRSFRTQYGLDSTVGQGGCARAVVHVGVPPAGPVIHRSGHVIGSEKTFDTGVIAVAGQKQLTLVADSAHDDRPAGADPFEIRDSFTWLQPVIELELEPFRAEVEKRLDASVWGWAGWTVANAVTKPAVVGSTWIPRPAPATRSRTETTPRDGFFSIVRKLEIRDSDRFLVLAVNRLEKEATASRIQVRLAGRTVGEFEVPILNSNSDPDPILVPVDPHRGKTIDVELVQFAMGATSRVEWRGIGTAAANPIERQLFDEDSGFVKQLVEGEATVLFDPLEKYSGIGSLRVVGDEKGNAAFSGWNIPIRAEPNPGEYRYLRFAWKKRGGKQLGIHLARPGGFSLPTELNPRESLRYHIGRGVEKDYGKSVQLRDTPPEQWEVVTRDLWGDFGPFDLTGLRFVCADGDSAWFDHVYLARAPHELDRATQRMMNPPPNPMNALTPDEKKLVERVADDPSQFGVLLGEVAPQFSTTASYLGVWLMKSIQGKFKVVQTHPPAPGQPCVLRAPVTIPAGKRAELRMTVGHPPQADWQLIVFANGEKLHDSLIGAETAKEGWADLTIDLSRFAGRNVVLEVHNHPNNWANERAYWHKLEVVFP